MKKLFFAGLAWLVFAGSGWAQVYFEPGMIVYSLRSGQVKTADIVLRSDAKVPEEITLELNYRYAGALPKDVAAWCSVTPKRVTLAQGDSRSIHLEFKGPAVRGGECLLSLYAGESMRTPIPVRLRMGMPIFIRLNDERRAEGEITALEPVFQGAGGMQIQVQIKNRGALHLVPFGVVWIGDAHGKNLWQTELRVNRPVLPQEEYIFKVPGPNTVIHDASELHVQLFWGTLYDNKAVGMPKTSAKQVPLKTARIN
jgi:hypothetical protein